MAYMTKEEIEKERLFNELMNNSFSHLPVEIQGGGDGPILLEKPAIRILAQQGAIELRVNASGVVDLYFRVPGRGDQAYEQATARMMVQFLSGALRDILGQFGINRHNESKLRVR